MCQDDTPEDKRAIQGGLQQVVMYPLAEYDGTMKSKDWTKLPQAPSSSSGDEEVKWVVPEKFFDELPAVLADAPPLPGEEVRYAQVRAILHAATNAPRLKEAMTKAAIEADAQLVTPLFQFRTAASNYRTTGARSRTARRSARTTSRARPLPGPTSSSTRRPRQSTSIRISTRSVRVSTAPTATR